MAAVWWVKEESDTENIAFALFTESFKKVLDLQGATFAQKLFCAQSIFIFSFNLYHVFSLIAHSDNSSFLYTYICVHIYMYFIYVYVRVRFEF